MHAKPVMLALCAGLIVPASAFARPAQQQLTVVAPEKAGISLDKWNDRTTLRLSRSIRQASSLYRDVNSTGYARVQFRVDDQGRPESVDLAGPSSSSIINRMSVRAVRGMGSLGPLPQEFRAGSKFEAWIIVANDADERESMLNSLHVQHRAQTMAQAPNERPILIAQR